MKICIGLRFIERDGKKILQGKWMDAYFDHDTDFLKKDYYANPYAIGNNYEWIDIPLEIEGEE